MTTSTQTPPHAARYTYFPDWARRTPRTIPALDMPRLTSLDTTVMQNLKPLGYFLVGRPVVAFALFLGAALNGWWVPAILLMWLVYGSALTAIHHLTHGSVGLSARARRNWLTVLGCLVVESGHAILATHALHHREDPDLPDPEGYIEMATWRELPLATLRYRYRLAMWGLRYSTRRRRVIGEMAFHAAAHITSLIVLPINPILWIYLTLIHVATVLFAALQCKGPQMNWGRDTGSPFMLVHAHRLVSMLLFSHEQHLEHHAYPKVPLPRMRQLRHHIEAGFADLDGLTHVHVSGLRKLRP